MGEWKQIFIWLIIFIVGSLIVSFIIYPLSFQSFTENIKFILQNKLSNSDTNTIKLIPSQMEEYNNSIFSSAILSLYKSCATLEAGAESQGISNIKQKTCREACGKRNMDYYSNDCEKDLLVCYCIP